MEIILENSLIFRNSPEKRGLCPFKKELFASSGSPVAVEPSWPGPSCEPSLTVTTSTPKYKVLLPHWAV